MKIINKAARLITFAFKKEKYKLLPAGGAVEVPDEAEDESQFLKTLLRDGSVRIFDYVDEEKAEEKAKAEAKEEAEKAVDTLRVKASNLGVDLDMRWGESRLKEEIEKAQAE